LEPNVDALSHGMSVAVFPTEGWIDVHRFVATLLKAAIGDGAAVLLGRAVTEIVLRGDRVSGIVLADGQRYTVDAVVNAAGAAGKDVAGLVGRHLPMRDDPGVVARLACAHVPIGRVMHAPRVELRPAGPGEVFV